MSAEISLTLCENVMDRVKYGFLGGFLGPPEKQSEKHFLDSDSMERGGLMQMNLILMPQTTDIRVVEGWILLKMPAGASTDKFHCMSAMRAKINLAGGCWNHLKSCGMCPGHCLALLVPISLQQGGDSDQLATS